MIKIAHSWHAHFWHLSCINSTTVCVLKVHTHHLAGDPLKIQEVYACIYVGEQVFLFEGRGHGYGPVGNVDAPLPSLGLHVNAWIHPRPLPADREYYLVPFAFQSLAQRLMICISMLIEWAERPRDVADQASHVKGITTRLRAVS